MGLRSRGETRSCCDPPTRLRIHTLSWSYTQPTSRTKSRTTAEERSRVLEWLSS